MSRLVLLAGALAAAPLASAQDGREQTRGQRTVVALFALAGGVTVPSVLYAGSTETWGSDAGRVVLLATAPLGMAAGTRAGADRLGLRAPELSEAVADAALGFVVGGAAFVIVGGGVGYELHHATGRGDYDVISPAVGGLVGLGVGLPFALGLSTRSVEAAPAVLAAPTGESALGLTLRVGL